MLMTLCLLTILFWGSAVVWRDLLRTWLQRKPLLSFNDNRRAQWESLPELVVAYVALLWLILHLIPQLTSTSTSQRSEIDLNLVKIQALINFGLVLILPAVLAFSERSWSRIGMSFSNLSDQICVGRKGFLAAVIPMSIAMAVTIPFRPPESQNSLLKLLQNSPEAETIIIVALTAVLSAPLMEELLFRVILQGWLTTIFPANLAISAVAIAFSLVHGWRDGLALLPLAFILGYVFHRRHSYLAVVMIHALFNATMLTLQLLNPEAP